MLELWCSAPGGCLSEDLLAAAVFLLASAAISSPTLEAQADAAFGLEKCLELAAQCLDVEALGRLQISTVERTLRRLDEAGEAMAARASERLLWPGQSLDGLPADVAATAPLRTLLALLLRCEGAERISGPELLELTRGDAALAVAVIAGGLAQPAPAGLERWHTQLARMLHHLTTPEAFGWLLQRRAATSGAEDLNGTPIAELQARRAAHCRALALSFVQFDMMDRMLRAAEDPRQRGALMGFFFRALRSLVGGPSFLESGRLISRAIALDFMRFGYRFVAPMVRKLLESTSTQQVRILRMVCVTLSWLLVYSEAEGSALLAESLRPLAAEWALRALSRGDVPNDGVAALLTLAANCGCLAVGVATLPGGSKVAPQLRAAALPLAERLRERVEGDARRERAVTAAGYEGLTELGFDIYFADADAYDEACPDDVDKDDWLFGGDNPQGEVAWEQFQAEEAEGALCAAAGMPGCVQLDEAVPCSECSQLALLGGYGEGYFENVWYCVRCWGLWNEAAPELVALAPWAGPEDGAEAARADEQRGAASLLLRMPDWLRCGVSGALLTSAAVRIPGATIQPIAFDRRSLERWHRRTGGKCPISGRALDLRTIVDAPDVLGAVRAWLQQEITAAAP